MVDAEREEVVVIYYGVCSSRSQKAEKGKGRRSQGRFEPDTGLILLYLLRLARRAGEPWFDPLGQGPIFILFAKEH